jgi:hypothetical protein
MTDFQGKIIAILQKRKENLPKLEAESVKIAKLRGDFRKLRSLLVELGSKDKKGALGGLSQAIALLDEGLNSLSERDRQIEHIARRFERPTINIGVSGQARVGKSTLLQKIAGLGDDEIPTGSGGPVTATRSQIFNQAEGQSPLAIIKYYDERDFIQKYVAALLELVKDIPGWTIDSLDAFKDFDLEKKKKEDQEKLKALPNYEKAVFNLDRLQEAKDSLPYYQSLLKGETKPIPNWNDLREYVSYPGDSHKKPFQRLYLAVEDIQIHCPFRHLPGVNIGLVDLPGLGEASKNVDQIQVNGLENEVDFVLLMRCPDSSQSCFVDGKLVDNIDKLRTVQRGIKNRGNFVSLLINEKAGCEEHIKNFKTDFEEKINHDGLYTVYQGNVRDPEYADVLLNQLLDHLAQKLPEMDKESLEACFAVQNSFNNNLKGNLENIQGRIKGIIQKQPSDHKQINQKAFALQGALAVMFSNRKNALRKSIESSSSDETNKYFAAVESIYNEIQAHIDDGLWEGAAWRQNAEYKITAAGNNPHGFFGDECNRIRVKIAECYNKMNEYFIIRLEGFREEVVEIFRKNTGSFVPDGLRGKEAIKAICEKLSVADHEMETFKIAFNWLLEINFDFRHNLFPEIREALEAIEAHIPSRDPPDLLTSEATRGLEGDALVDYVYDILKSQSHKANFDIAQSIKEKANAAEKFIFAALEYVDDILVRREDWLNEYGDFCEQFRSDLWPEQYGQVTDEAEQYRHVRSAISEVLALI